MVTQADLVKATLKKLSKRTHDEINKRIAGKGKAVATTFLAGIIASKTGLSREKSTIIANIIVKRSVKLIRDRLKD